MEEKKKHPNLGGRRQGAGRKKGSLNKATKAQIHAVEVMKAIGETNPLEAVAMEAVALENSLDYKSACKKWRELAVIALSFVAVRNDLSLRTRLRVNEGAEEYKPSSDDF